jgi:Ala-tRNA(Pro) deacylase
MSVVTEHLEQRRSAFELLPHRQAYTSTDEARALGIDAGDVLKTLAVRTGPGYALMVIPASRRLDLHLARDALGDSHARLASEEELGRDFASYQLGALPPLGALVGASVYVDPEVLGHDTVAFAAGSQTESVKMRTQELFGSQRVTTVPLVEQADPGQRRPDRSAAGGAADRGRRRAPSAVTGSQPATTLTDRQVFRTRWPAARFGRCSGGPSLLARRSQRSRYRAPSRIRKHVEVDAGGVLDGMLMGRLFQQFPATRWAPTAPNGWGGCAVHGR